MPLDNPAERGTRGHGRAYGDVARSSLHTHTRDWNPLRGLAEREVKSGRPPAKSALLVLTLMRHALFVSLLCGTVLSDDACSSGVCIVAPLVALTGMRTELQLSLPPLTPHGSVWPVNATVTVTDCGDGGGARVLAQVNLSLWSGDAPADGGRDLLRQHRIPVPRWPSGYTEVGVRLEALQGDEAQGDDSGTPPPLYAAGCGGGGGSGGGSGGGAARVRVWSVPPWLSILPPVATLLLAVWLRQVMVGLLVGIWLGATIAYGGNPLTG